jgi:hypothetical protein
MLSSLVLRPSQSISGSSDFNNSFGLQQHGSLGRRFDRSQTDSNGDGGTSNDLIYIPRNVDEMNFQTFTASGRTFTAAEQAAAWETCIRQDAYLRANRGRHAGRGAVFLPIVQRMDVGVAQNRFRLSATSLEQTATLSQTQPSDA